MREVWRVDFKHYDRLLSLSGAGWAWEFKRRDPALSAARRRSGALAAHSAKRADGSTIYRLAQRCHAAESFGLHFIPDPGHSALEAAPFWLPEAMSASFDGAIDANTSGTRSAKRIKWADLPGEKFFLISPGRRDKLVIRAPCYTAQIALDGDGAPVPHAEFFSLRLGADQLAAERLRHLEAFALACRGSTAPLKHRRGASPEKLRGALIALDGELAGVPRRRIADAIFGASLVADDWDSGVNSYKQRTKRLVDKGLALMKSGYRGLL